MVKPLFRFTVGSCLQQGLDILAESMLRTTRCLGDFWDYAVCYNGLKKSDLEFLKKAAGKLKIEFIPQNWIDCPVEDHCQSPRRTDGSFEWNGSKCGGTMWKVCPPRLRMETHEIVMDNDIILLRKPPQIDQFLCCKDKALLLEEPIRFYGRYDHLFTQDEPYLNSGLMGFPPDYDFGEAISENWNKFGKLTNISQADEQGLLTYTLKQLPSFRLKPHEIVEVLHQDKTTRITGSEFGIHFTQSNRLPNHYQWTKYREMSILI